MLTEMKMISEDYSNCSNSNGMKSKFDFKHSYRITGTTFDIKQVKQTY